MHSTRTYLSARSATTAAERAAAAAAAAHTRPPSQVMKGRAQVNTSVPAEIGEGEGSGRHVQYKLLHTRHSHASALALVIAHTG